MAGLFLLWIGDASLWAKGDKEGSQDMILIPEGEFLMGSSEPEINWVARTFFSESLDWYADEIPEQKLYLNRFYIDRTEITVAEYRSFMEATGHSAPRFGDNAKFNQDAQPVVGVTWEDASAYCKWRGKRLPTEQEWEKAARGSDGKRYPWGGEPDPRRANVRGLEDGFRYTAPVGSFVQGQSPYGLLDMSGNVWEWTLDWYQPYPGNMFENELYGNKLKVIRGGSWNSNLDLARSALRGKAIPDRPQNSVGFRCAR